MEQKNIRSYKALWYFASFGFLFIWFSRIYPLVAYDGDDWQYLSYVRKAIPLWQNWNPSRVLPEVLMPLCGAVAAFVVTPLTGDYIRSVTLVSALVVSGSIVVYLHCFARLMERRFSLSGASAVLLSMLFLVLHFLVMCFQDSYNNYLFLCNDLTCYYFYLIPALLNCSLVMWMMAGFDQDLTREGSLKKQGLFVVAVYFAIFSNLPDSVILAIYAGVRLLLAFIRDWKSPYFRKSFLRKNVPELLIVAAWFVSAIFELNGGRASADMGYRLPPLQGLKETVHRFCRMVFYSNRFFLLFAFLVVIGAIAVLAFTKEKGSREKEVLSTARELILCAILMVAAIVILCVKVDVCNINRSEYVFGIYFYGLLLLFTAFTYLLHKFPKLMLALPLVICILASSVITPNKTFLSANYQDCDSSICIAVINDVIDQLRTAQEAGQSEATIHVPVSEPDDNWPLSSFTGDMMASTLYDHGVLSRPIQVTVQPDPEMNKKYDLPIPETVQLPSPQS